MIPAYLNDLHLDQILASYTSNVEQFIQQSSGNEHIVDSESIRVSGFVTSSFGLIEDRALKFFEVHNPRNKPFSLLQVDNGAISSSAPTKRCDCCIITDIDLAFIEFKANALSTNTKTIRSNYKSAMRQLRATISIFAAGVSSFGGSLSALRSNEAYVCFRRGYPRLTTSEMTYRASFAIQTGFPLSFIPRKAL